MKITFENIELWLGTSNPDTEAIETLVDIANGDYKPKIFKKDVIDTIKQFKE